MVSYSVLYGCSIYRDSDIINFAINSRVCLLPFQRPEKPKSAFVKIGSADIEFAKPETVATKLEILIGDLRINSLKCRYDLPKLHQIKYRYKFYLMKFPSMSIGMNAICHT